MPASNDVIYTLDASDAIVEVNEAWISFASENSGTHLLPPPILGRNLWDFISDRTTKQVYVQLFERVRAGATEVRFSFRCDAPEYRRLLEMKIMAQPAGVLSLVVQPQVVERREPVLLLDAEVRRGANLLRMCAWCKRIPDANGNWLEIEEALPQLGLFEQNILPTITHGVCEDCTRALTGALDDPTLAASGAVVLGGLKAA